LLLYLDGILAEPGLELGFSMKWFTVVFLFTTVKPFSVTRSTAPDLMEWGINSKTACLLRKAVFFKAKAARGFTPLA